MGKIIVFLILTLISLILLLGCLVNGVRWGVCAENHGEVPLVFSL